MLSVPTVCPADEDQTTAPDVLAVTAPARGIEHQRIKGAVRGALFGGEPDPVRIGRFTVLKRLGAGAMGVVYSAFDDELDRKVAIKVLRADRAKGDEGTRLRREAQAIARLSHPNVVPVFEVGEHDGRVFIAMEFVRGDTLRSWLEAKPRKWRDVLEMYAQAGRGLAAAHAAGLVHRDFKPENVIVGEDGRVRVVDFGLASVGVASAPSEPVVEHALRITATGAVLGTPAYMAPEQHEGLAADARSDQFAFCVALWEALYERRPYAGETYAELMANVVAGRLVDPPAAAAVPRQTRRALEQGLQRERDKRFESMDQLIASLVPPQRQFVWKGMLAAALTAGLSSGIATTLMDDDGDGACTPLKDKLAGTWNEERRAQTQAALAAKPGLSLQAWDSVESSIDDYVGRWSAAYTEACEPQAELAEEERLQRQLCLEWARKELSSLADALANAAAADVPAFAEHVAALPEPSACSDADTLGAQVQRRAPPPMGSEQGLISDFDGDQISEFGAGWQVSTDQMIGGNSRAQIDLVRGAENTPRGLRVQGTVDQGKAPAAWAGAMFFPGKNPMVPANLSSKRAISFYARATPGQYAVMLFDSDQMFEPSVTPITVGKEWTRITVDLDSFGTNLHDVTMIYIGAGDMAGQFELVIDDVRLLE